MNILEIIAKKRDKKELTKEEIDYFVKEYTNGTITDYQAAALIMAIYINGMTTEEITNLTLAMAYSGDVLDLSKFGENVVDKHSTGGIGDKITLILMPIVAALGVPVAKMSGRGLGFTGGTIDKLESIPGYNTQISVEEFMHNVDEIGISLMGQTLNLAPADKKLYALRDTISCVDNIPLIASSVMSKKIASGADKIIIDVKVGNAMPIMNIPVGTVIHNIEMRPGKGAELARSAGASAQILGRDGKYVILRLQSGETRKVLGTCMATIGSVGNEDFELVNLGKEQKVSKKLLESIFQKGITL